MAHALETTPTGDAATASAAVTAAESAARHAGVAIRELTELADMRRVYQLVNEIWQPDPVNAPVTADILRALTKAGNYLSGAYEGEELVGTCIAFLAAPPGRALHSHVAGVTSRARGRNIAFALKLHQRAWALSRGLDQISWTFDPLVARNAYFNLVKLAARPVEYLPNFYGAMDDALNAGEESDRLLIHWQLDAPAVADAAEGITAEANPTALRDRGATIGLRADNNGHPEPGDITGPTVLVNLPPDIEGLRRVDPTAARAWRHALRSVLRGLLEEGSRVTGFAREVGYVVERR